MSAVGDPVGIASASFTLIFSLTTGTVKKITKHILAKSKLNSIETIFQALIDMEISHEEFIVILKGKDKYEETKENLRSGNEKEEIMRLSSIK